MNAGLEMEAKAFADDAEWRRRTAELEAELRSEGGYRPWTASELFWRNLPKQRSEDLRRAEHGYRSPSGWAAGIGLANAGWLLIGLLVGGAWFWFHHTHSQPRTSMEFFWDAAPAQPAVELSVWERRSQV